MKCYKGKLLKCKLIQNFNKLKLIILPQTNDIEMHIFYKNVIKPKLYLLNSARNFIV